MNETHLKLTLHNTSDSQGGKPFADAQRVMFSSSTTYPETEVGEDHGASATGIYSLCTQGHDFGGLSGYPGMWYLCL